MTGRSWRAWLQGLSATMLAALLLFVITPVARTDPKPPKDSRERARWLAHHPSDWLTAALLSDQALNSSMTQRVGVWRAAHEHAAALTPRHLYARSSFVRGGLFHWDELAPGDRAVLLAESEELLKQPEIFVTLHEPLWRLTGDFALIRRGAPKTLAAIDQLRELAAREGLFHDYREVREAVRKQRLADFEAIRATAPPIELFRLLPRDLYAADRPFVQALLEELHTRPLDADPERRELAGELIDFAIRNRMQPLDGIDYFLRDPAAAPDPERARLALALGQSAIATQIRLASNVVAEALWAQFQRERGLPTPIDAQRWEGLCGQGEDLCRVAERELLVGSGGKVTLDIDAVEHDHVAPYVEIYLDGRIVSEGPVEGTQRFAFDAAPGRHRLELRLVNRVASNAGYRRVRLSSMLS